MCWTSARWRSPMAATARACRRAPCFRPAGAKTRGCSATRWRSSASSVRRSRQAEPGAPRLKCRAEEVAMARIIHTASAQMGPIAKSETRKDTVRRLIALMREAKGRGAELVVFTELALVTFFPRWMIENEAELDSYYEKEMPGPETQPLFD